MDGCHGWFPKVSLVKQMVAFQDGIQTGRHHSTARAADCPARATTPRRARQSHPQNLWYTRGDATGLGYLTVPRSSASLHVLPLLGDAMSAMLLKNAHLDDFAEAQDILIENGKIARVAPAGVLPEPRTEDVLDCEGRAVIPGFVETHLHLDKALLDARM